MPLDVDAVNRYSNMKFDEEEKFIEFMGALVTKPISVRLGRVGHSKGFIIPKQLLEYLELEMGDSCELIIIKREKREKED